MTAKTVTIKLDANTKKLIDGTRKAQNQIKALVKAAAGLYIIKQGFDLAAASAKSFINTAAQFEQFETTLKTIEGSSQAAKQSMDWIKNFASSTPYELAQVTESFVKLKAYGIELTDGTLRTLGDTAAAMGKDINQAVEAMADAVTGENERLKEFGIKAKVQGDKIAYAWSDAIGKAKHIVIKNSREIIQSTLSAIMNSKYAGAMAEQAKTWNGMVSNMKDKWTIFKSDVMDAGLFDYLKAIVGVVGDYLGAAFGDAKKGAASFSESVIAGIESSISAVGVLKDTWSLFAGVFDFLKTAFWQMVGVFGTGMNAIQSAWNTMSNAMSVAWANLANGVKEMFQGIVNYIIDKVNYISDAVNKAATTVGLDPVFGKLEHVSFEKTKAEITKLGEPISNVETAWKNAKDAQDDYKKHFNDLLNGTGQKSAEKAIGDIKEKLKEITKETKGAADEQKKYNDLLKKLGAKDGDIGDALKKSSSASKKAIKDTEKEAKKAADEAQKHAERFTQDFASAFEGVLGGDVSSAFRSFFNNISTQMVKPWIDDLSKSLSSGLNSLLGGLGTGGTALLGVGVGALGSMLGGLFSSTLSEAEIEAARGRSEFDSEFFSTQKELYEQYNKPGITIAQKQLDRLKSLDAKFASVALALQNSTSGFKLDGSDFVSSESNILGGLYTSSTELLGSGIKFDTQTVDQLMNDAIVTGYQSVKESSSALFGLISSESIKESERALSDGVKDTIQEIIETSFDGVADNLDVLGFDVDKFNEALKNQVVEMGKIDLKDMDAEEQAKALQGAIGEMVGDAVDGALSSFSDPQALQSLQNMQTAGEEFTTTISRVAVGLETAQVQLEFFGQSVENFNQSQALIDAAGGLDAFNSGMDAFMSGFFTEDEQRAYLESQLKYALAVYDVALPASEEQFKALVLETQEKIISTQATIDTLKAEIAAKVAAGEMSLAAAYGELDAKGQIAQAQSEVNKAQISSNNYLIDSAHNAGRAAVSYGKSINNSVKAMVGAAANAVVDGAKTSVDAAGNIDYSRITSPAIQAAEASLAELQGLYGTLMNNMGSFSDYYGDVGSSASSAASALGELTQRLYDIAAFKAELTDNKVESAKIVLDATTEKTGLTDLTLDNVLSKLDADMSRLTDGYSDVTSANNAYASSCGAVASSCSLAANSCSTLSSSAGDLSDANSDLLQDYKDQYAALKAYHDALIANKRGFEDLQMLWEGADSITVANTALSRAVEDTKLIGVNSGNFLDKMNEAMEAGDDVEKWQKLSDALRSVSQVYRDMAQDIFDLADHTRQAVLSIGAYTAEKQFQSIEDAINSQDYKAASSAFDNYANTIKGNNALTQKEKVFRIADANAMVQKIEKTNPNDEVIKELQKLRAENEAIREELKKIEYNTYITSDKTNDFVKVVGV